MLARLQLPENLSKATRHTRLDGAILGRETRCENVGPGKMMQIGIDVKRDDDKYKMVVWVVENKYHVGWCWLTLTKDGQMIEGSYCTRGLVLKVDQEWADWLIEILECKLDLWEEKWDEIELQ